MEKRTMGALMSALRKSKGMTQQDVADRLGVSNKAVSKWESGRGYPSIDSLKEIANYFSVTIDELLSGEKIISIAEKENKNNCIETGTCKNPRTIFTPTSFCKVNDCTHHRVIDSVPNS